MLICRFIDLYRHGNDTLYKVRKSGNKLHRQRNTEIWKVSSDKHTTRYFNVLLTVHVSIPLVNDQLDARLLYFIIRLLQSSTCFEKRRAHHQEVKLY